MKIQQVSSYITITQIAKSEVRNAVNAIELLVARLQPAVRRLHRVQSTQVK